MAGEEEVKEEEVKEEEVVAEETEEEVQEESLEDKIARLQAENDALAKEKKEYHEEKSRLGRRTREAEERQLAFEQKLREIESRMANASGSNQTIEEDIDSIISDPVRFKSYIKRIADEEINTRVQSESAREKQYAEEYHKEIMKLKEDEGMDDNTFEKVDKLLETRFKDYHTGDGKVDASMNFLKAAKEYYKSGDVESRKPLNLKKDKATGAGVGGPTTVSKSKGAGKALSDADRELARKLGRSEEWAKEALYGS